MIFWYKWSLNEYSIETTIICVMHAQRNFILRFSKNPRKEDEWSFNVGTLENMLFSWYVMVVSKKVIRNNIKTCHLQNYVLLVKLLNSYFIFSSADIKKYIPVVTFLKTSINILSIETSIIKTWLQHF